MISEKRVILPGSYDPVTLGHIDIVKRVAEIYREVYVVIFVNPEKKYTFSVEERIEMLRIATKPLKNVFVDYSPGRVVDYMRENKIDLIVKGYRNNIDLEYERAQAEYNKIHGGYETELLLSSSENINVSSTLARDTIMRGEDASKILPSGVAEYIASLKNNKI